MTTITFIIAAVIGNLLVAQAAFIIFRHFILKRQRCYENKIEELKDQVKNNKFSESLFKQEQQRLMQEYHVAFFNRWFSGAK